jgi:hypothetical protein
MSVAYDDTLSETDIPATPLMIGKPVPLAAIRWETTGSLSENRLTAPCSFPVTYEFLAKLKRFVSKRRWQRW